MDVPRIVLLRQPGHRRQYAVSPEVRRDETRVGHEKQDGHKVKEASVVLGVGVAAEGTRSGLHVQLWQM